MTAKEVREIREALGLSQRQFADRVGVTESTVWRWEAGMHPIRRPTVLLIRSLPRVAASA